MPGTATITITGTQQGGNTGNRNYPSASIVNTSAVESVVVQALSAVYTAITAPAGSLGVYILPIGNTQTITLKGVTGDTGIALSKTNPSVLAFDTSVPAFGFLAGGATTVWLIFI